MRLVTFASNGQARLGAQVGQQIVDLPGTYAAWLRAEGTKGSGGLSAEQFPTDAIAFLAAGERAREGAERALAFAAGKDRLAELAGLGLAFPVDAVVFRPPILRPNKIICLGLNYRHHVAEVGREMPQYPVLFARFASTLIGHRQPIVLPTVSDKVDYEAELAVVMGRTGKDIPPEAAFDYVAGYSVFNDVSVRDYQNRTPQWLQGKNFDGSGPLGPALVTADEITDPQALDISLRLNGEVMQQSNTSDFIFDIPTVIHYLSQIMTLEPGDLIATGTPGGVGFVRQPPVFLKAGDLVQVEISELGILENRVVEPRKEAGHG